MRYGIVVSLGILIVARGATALQDSPENAILRRAVTAVQKAEPAWRFIGVMLTRSPLMDEELGAAAGEWYQSLDDLSTGVSVVIYRISTTEAAAEWLYRQAHGGVMTKEWTVTSYELGDGANMATYVGPFSPTQYNLVFRKGQSLADLGGRSKETVEHFAQVLLAEMSD